MNDPLLGRIIAVLLTALLPVLGLLGRAEADGRELPESAQTHLATFDAAWRIIHETYFDPTFNGLDWNAVRSELRPKAIGARNVQELRRVIGDMLNRLGESHMAIIPRDAVPNLDRKKRRFSDHSQQPVEPGTSSADEPLPERERDAADDSSRLGEGELGFEVRFVEGRPVVTRVDANGPAAKAGVKPGWIIHSINGQTTSHLLEPLLRELLSRRGQFMAWRLLMGELTGDPGSKVSLEFLDGADETVTLALERRREQGEPVKLGYLPTLYARFESETLPLRAAQTIGLIRFNLWMIPIVRALDEKIDEFRQADGIVLDLRGNLGGLGGMILGVSGHFLNERVSLGTMKMRGSDLNFYANPRRVSTSSQRVEPFSGPLAILIDGLTLSAAEIFAGGMQAVGRARVFGEISGGQALPAIWDRLPNGDVLYHAFGDFVTASGVRLEGRGVRPDETVAVTREDLLAGRDEPLLAAKRWIAEQNAKRNPSLPDQK